MTNNNTTFSDEMRQLQIAYEMASLDDLDSYLYNTPPDVLNGDFRWSYPTPNAISHLGLTGSSTFLNYVVHRTTKGDPRYTMDKLERLVANENVDVNRVAAFWQITPFQMAVETSVVRYFKECLARDHRRRPHDGAWPVSAVFKILLDSPRVDINVRGLRVDRLQKGRDVWATSFQCVEMFHRVFPTTWTEQVHKMLLKREDLRLFMCKVRSEGSKKAAFPQETAFDMLRTRSRLTRKRDSDVDGSLHLMHLSAQRTLALMRVAAYRPFRKAFKLWSIINFWVKMTGEGQHAPGKRGFNRSIAEFEEGGMFHEFL